DVRVEGLEVRISATVTIEALEGAPDGLGMRGHRRDSEEIAVFEVTDQDLRPNAPNFAVSAVHRSLSRGVWDMFVVVHFGDYEKEIRIGATRSRSVAPEGSSNLADFPRVEDRLIAYFTKGPGNLSIDRGGLVTRHTTTARGLGITPAEHGGAHLPVGAADPRPGGRRTLSGCPRGQARLIAWSPAGQGSLSIDRGGLITRHTTTARTLGISPDENGRALLLVETPAPLQDGDEFFCYLTGTPQH